MHICAEGTPEVVDAPAPTKMANGAERRTPIDLTKASRERTMSSEACPSSAFVSIRTLRGDCAGSCRDDAPIEEIAPLHKGRAYLQKANVSYTKASIKVTSSSLTNLWSVTSKMVWPAGSAWDAAMARLCSAEL